MASITFLGTGTGPYVVGKGISSAGGIVIKLDDLQFHIDPGPGALMAAKTWGVNLRENTVVLVSHSHLNHSGDLNAVLSAMTYDGLDRKGVLIANEQVINGSEDSHPVLTKYHRKLVERFIVAKPGQKIGIEDIEIRILPAVHPEQNTLGFKFITPTFVLTYTADTAYSKEVVEQYEKSDILILNVVHPAGQKSDSNLSSDDAAKIIGMVKPQLAIIQHFGKQMVEADPLYESREIQKKTNVQVIQAQDGMSISPSTYATAIKQRTLNVYEGKEPSSNAPDS